MYKGKKKEKKVLKPCHFDWYNSIQNGIRIKICKYNPLERMDGKTNKNNQSNTFS